MITTWGKNGVRWDEECSRCGRCTEIDNNTELCEKCQTPKNLVPKIDVVATDPYRRGIGEGFGNSDDGEVK